jgi:hypothetical protein
MGFQFTVPVPIKAGSKPNRLFMNGLNAMKPRAITVQTTAGSPWKIFHNVVKYFQLITLKTNNMSLEQIDLETLYDRNELEQLSKTQLCKLLSITIKELRSCGFSKDNLIELFLSKHAEL